jgi:hypothetical protein
MMRFGLSIIAIAGLAGAAGAQAPSRAMLHHTSWGKAGVSLDDYRADAQACAREAVNLDISNTDAAKALVTASRAIDTAYSSAWMYAPASSVSFPGPQPSSGGGGVWGGAIGHDVQQIEHRYRVDEQFADIAGLQYRTLDTCLTARGYHQFRLTAEQEARLAHLRHGSDERRFYLHSLGSDPEVLSRQAL